ncbi:MAG: hypothetical protein M1820_009818 [Bogoriella megaspora]|nr:MAG: hypothetical protein M1820_009818 [Bogoriella megaspora]
MAKSSPDATEDNQGGFASDSGAVTGFSHMHDSGTGGSQSLGNFQIFPQAGCPGDDVFECVWSKDNRTSNYTNITLEARPNYFALTLNTSIRAEMTVSNRSALYRFTFPENPSASGNSSLKYSPIILADLTDLPNSRINGSAFSDPRSGRLSGTGAFSPSFGDGSYFLHFCADFKGADVRRTGIFNDTKPTIGRNSFRVRTNGSDELPDVLSAGSWVQFHAPEKNEILVRVGVSFKSIRQACSNAEKEIPDFDFEGTRKSGEDAWREKLSVISVDAEGVSDELQTVFWSGTYRSMFSPQDYTGENYLWDSSEPYYDSYYCIWDSFRSIHPLITLLDPQSQTLMIRSLIDTYKHLGKLPDCRMSLCKGFTQGGSNADVVLADSYLKGISEGVDWNLGYEAVVSDAEIEPPNWDLEGRGGLANWKRLGYIPTNNTDLLGNGTETRSISRTVEYAYDDFCISEMAKGLGHPDDYVKYTRRARNWKNMYLANQTSYINGTDTGFVGFLQPRYQNKTWGFQDPIFCSPLLNFTSCYLNPDGHETYEGSSWLYTFYVPQDMAALIKTLGGPKKFTDRLSYLHTSGLLYIGDEQAFLPVFQFHYAGRPALSAYFAHYYIPSQFNTTRVGIPGNDDSGAMGSFSTLSMMGLWPVSGQNVYLITPPFFPSVNVTNGQTGKTATIRNVNFDAEYKNIYIQSATLNGKPYTKNWITHDFWTRGDTLELTLGPKESDWGTGEEDLPPSLSTRKEGHGQRMMQRDVGMEKEAMGLAADW